MCLSCGCGKPHESHGNSANITYEDLAAAAKLDKTTVNAVLKSINNTVIKDRVKHESEYTEVVK